MIPPALKHQLVSMKHSEKTDIVFDTSDPGCVSADTEYLTPTGWKRIDQYTAGEQVAQFYPATREIEFVLPLAYIKKPCTEMINIAPARGTSQRLSLEHRVLYYAPSGAYGVCSAAEFMEHLHRRGANHAGRKFCSTFSVRSETQIELTDPELRLMVAVIADGYFGTPSTNRCVIRLKKPRKQVRLRELLEAANTPYKVRACDGTAEGFEVFSFYAPLKHKEFGPSWWAASQLQLEVIATELPHWDSSVSTRPSGGIRFSTFVETSAHFAQYAFSANKQPTSLDYSYRNRTGEDRGVMVEYTVHAQQQDKLIGPGRPDSVFLAPNKEGFKYCFEVSTSFLLLRHNGYIFATGNTGKTAVRVMVFSKRRKAKKGKMLVLAPRTLLRNVWFNDFKKFAPHLKVSVANAANRIAAFKEEADVYVTNVDAVKWLAQQKKPFFDQFSEIVVDESTCYKHHSSQRSKAAASIMKYFKYRALLTGTPNSNSITDVWHQVKLLDDGRRLGPSFYAFRNSVCTPVQVGRSAQMVQWQDREGAEEAVFGLISDIVIRHKFEDCVDIPPNHQYAVEYEMPPKQQRAYDELEATQMLWLQEKKGAVPAVLAINAAAVATKLLQIASGAVYEGPDKYHVIDTARYELILDKAMECKHALVVYQWKHQRDLLVAEAEKRGIKYCVLDSNTSDAKREMYVAGYQSGFYQAMFGHPKNIAHGLTLTRGTRTIWASPTYDLEWFAQGSKRQHRLGQTQKTETIIIVAKGTHDEKAYASMLDKNTRMTNLLDLFGTTKEVTVSKPKRKIKEFA